MSHRITLNTKPLVDSLHRANELLGELSRAARAIDKFHERVVKEEVQRANRGLVYTLTTEGQQ